MIEEKEKFYTCKYDRVFKEIMLKKENRVILYKILEKTLNIKINKIIEENIELKEENIHVKRKSVDILLSTDKGIIGIEMNSNMKNYLHVRNYAYHCSNYAHFTKTGSQYLTNNKIIQINFTFGIKEKNIKVLEKYEMQNKRGIKFIENSIIYEWNMDKVKDIWYSKDEKEIEEYKYIIMLDLNMEELKLLDKICKDMVVRKYMKEIKILNDDPDYVPYMTVEEDIEKCRNTELYLEGMEAGKSEGIKAGIKTGRKEEKLSIARNMKKLGISMDKIIKSTGLSLKELQML